MKKQKHIIILATASLAAVLSSCEPSLNGSLANRGVMSDRELHYRGSSRADTIQEVQTRGAVRQDQYDSTMHPLNMANGVLGGLNSARNNVSWLTR